MNEDFVGARERLLLVRVGAMGDVLHALPAVSALRALRPDLGIDWVVDPRWAPLLAREDGSGPIVSRVHLAETRLWSKEPLSSRTLRSVLGLRRDLQEGAYSTAVDVQGTLRSAVLGRFAGARRFAGFADPREAPAALLYQKHFQRCGRHVVEQNAALLSEALGMALEPSRIVLLPHHVKADAWAAALVGSDARPVALLAPTAGWGAKQWPAERFGALAGRLHGDGMRVLVNAASAQEPTARRVVEASGGAAEIAICSVVELVALVRRVGLLVGGDSGPVHLAATLGVPCVALYGPTDPARNGPWGAGVVRVLRDAASVTSHKRVAGADAGLLRMGVEEVWAAVREALAAG